MRREFLQNFKVNDQALPKEIVDAIMAENGRDIEAVKDKYSDYDTVKNQLEEAKTTIADFKAQGNDIEAVRTKAAEWEQKYNDAITAHKQAMADRDFSDKLNGAISKAHGKNSKAIMALLDVDTLKASKNQEADIQSAIEACQKENDYLFGSDKPAPFAVGTGVQNNNTNNNEVTTLAGALREKYAH